MKFILISCLNTLPTQDNLKLWNKSTYEKCALCGNSTLHTLSGCKVGVEQGRYTWRHDNIIKYIADGVDTVKYSVFSDIEGYRNTTGGTLDPVISVNTNQEQRKGLRFILEKCTPNLITSNLILIKKRLLNITINIYSSICQFT